MFSTLLLSALATSTAVAKDIGTVGTVTSQVSLQKLASGSELVALNSDPAYVDPIYVVSLHGETPYDQGYDAGVLVGQQFYDNYHVRNCHMHLFSMPFCFSHCSICFCCRI